MSAYPDFPKHVVTAVLVSHDGERWLPEVLAGLVGQDRPVQDVIAADTGSADSSATLIGEAIGPDRVLHLARRSSFGTAVMEAVRTAAVLTPDDLPYLKRPDAWDPESRTWDTSTYDLPELPHGEPVHWLWLLHDDAAPAPDALAELLRQADARPSAAIIGAKLRGWYDRRQLLEAGVSIANSGRRWTGLDRREQDQGQHDQVRPVLSVSTAGMLIRRDVFEQLGGFDRALPLMRDDVDLCWRAQAAGHQVLIAPGAVLRHAEASARERRSIDCAGRLGGSPHRVDKAAAVYTLLVNSRARKLPWILCRLVLGTLLRVLAYLVGKLPRHALDETAGLFATLLRPGRVIAARKRRKQSTDPAELRPLFPPPGATIRAAAEQLAGGLANRSTAQAPTGGRHGSVESGPGDDDSDSLEIEQFVRLKRVARKPGPVLFVLLLLVSLAACRQLIGGGALAGGALLPAPAEAGELWARYFHTWQPIATGGAESAPPYLAFLALLSTLALGSPGLVMTLLLVCSVPLAGASAYFSSASLLPSRLLRAWGSIAYAVLPAITGALAAGRVGTAVLAILLPPLARAAASAAGYTKGGKGSWRAAWVCALLLTIVIAFTPVIWPLAGLLALIAVFVPVPRGAGLRKARALRLGAALLTPAALLSPWSWSALTSPSALLREAGLPYETEPASAFQLLSLSPGGPGTTGSWLLIGLLLAALGALLRKDRRMAVGTAWAVALVSLLFAVWANRDQAAWAGPTMLVYGLALLSAAALGADGARHRVATQSFGWRQPVAVVVAVTAALGPLLAAAGWVLGGANGPLERRNPVQVPAFVAEESASHDQARTLVLAGEGGSDGELAERVSYALVRGSGARLGDADLAAQLGEQSSLRKAAGDLVAGSGADQTAVLAGFAVRYILVQDGTPLEVHRVLDTTPGLRRLSQEDGSALWRVERDLARVMLIPAEDDPDTAPARIAAGPVEVHTDIPEGPAGRTVRLADSASPGWQATLDGEPLTRTKVGGWAQGFELPASGGRLDITHQTSGTHTMWVWGQGALLLVLIVLALPGRRREVDDDLPDRAAEAAGPVTGEGRRARRQRASAVVAAAPAEAAAPGAPQAPNPGDASSEPVWSADGHSMPEGPDETMPGAEPPTAAPQWQESGYQGEPEYGQSPYPQDPYLPGQQQAPYPMPDPYQQQYPYQQPQPYYPQGEGAPPQPYGDQDDQGYAPYDYPADYGDGSSQR